MQSAGSARRGPEHENILSPNIDTDVWSLYSQQGCVFKQYQCHSIETGHTTWSFANYLQYLICHQLNSTWVDQNFSSKCSVILNDLSCILYHVNSLLIPRPVYGIGVESHIQYQYLASSLVYWKKTALYRQKRSRYGQLVMQISRCDKCIFWPQTAVDGTWHDVKFPTGYQMTFYADIQ